MSGKRVENTFWVSYSDLATGLMMVFLLLMVVMMFAQLRQQRRQAQQEAESKREIQAVLEQLAIVLGTKAELAQTLHERLNEPGVGLKVRVDPVTARVEIDEAGVGFKNGEWGWDKLSQTNQRGLETFGANYICALWRWECQDCEPAYTRLDPEGARSIRRVFLVGNADLTSAHTDDNQRITALRAKEVQRGLMAHLKRCRAQGPDATCFARTDCDAEQVWKYAQERLHAVGAGHTKHCINQADDLHGDCAKGAIADPRFRTVEFRAELTNADLTGLVGDLYELSRNVDGLARGDATGGSASARFESVLEPLVEACISGSTDAAGCDALRARCATSSAEAVAGSFRCQELGQGGIE